MSIVITQEKYKERCAKYGFTAMSPYVSIHAKIEVMCNKHGEKFITTLDQIKRCRCPKCYEENNKNRIDKYRLTNGEVDSRLVGKNIVRIGNVNGRHSKIEWQCSACNHLWKQTPGNIIHESNPTGCPSCRGGVKDTRESYLDKIKDREDLVMVGNYINSQTKTEFKCLNCNFNWKSKPANVLNLGRGCPCCKRKSEKMVGDILKDIDIVAHHNFYIKTPDRKFLIDWFITDKNIAIEYNGEQHYRPVQFGGMSLDMAKDKFINQVNRDMLLREYCKNNSINLIEIDGRKYSNRNLDKMKEYTINSIRGITNV